MAKDTIEVVLNQSLQKAIDDLRHFRSQAKTEAKGHKKVRSRKTTEGQQTSIEELSQQQSDAWSVLRGVLSGLERIESIFQKLEDKGLKGVSTKASKDLPDAERKDAVEELVDAFKLPKTQYRGGTKGGEAKEGGLGGMLKSFATKALLPLKMMDKFLGTGEAMKGLMKVLGGVTTGTMAKKDLGGAFSTFNALMGKAADVTRNAGYGRDTDPLNTSGGGAAVFISRNLRAGGFQTQGPLMQHQGRLLGARSQERGKTEERDSGLGDPSIKWNDEQQLLQYLNKKGAGTLEMNSDQVLRDLEEEAKKAAEKEGPNG